MQTSHQKLLKYCMHHQHFKIEMHTEQFILYKGNVVCIKYTVHDLRKIAINVATRETSDKKITANT